MANSSSSAAFTKPAWLGRIPWLDIWMLLTAAAFLAVYMLLRVRVANYLRVIGWFKEVVMGIVR